MGKIAIGCFAGGVHFGTSVKRHHQWISQRFEDSEGESCQRDSAGNLPCAWDACVQCGISKIKAPILINTIQHPTTTPGNGHVLLVLIFVRNSHWVPLRYLPKEGTKYVGNLYTIYVNLFKDIFVAILIN